MAHRACDQDPRDRGERQGRDRPGVDVQGVQQLRVDASGTISLSFGGTPARNIVVGSNIVATGSTTLVRGAAANNAAAVQASLNTINALIGNVIVTTTDDPDVLNITFINNLTGQNVAQIVSSNSAVASVSTLTQGVAPTAAAFSGSYEARGIPTEAAIAAGCAEFSERGRISGAPA